MQPNYEENKDDGHGNYDQVFNQDIVIIDESTKQFQQIQPDYLRMIANRGINQAMREIIEMVIRRVIPIASITTRLLVLKDFALEPNPEKLQQASILTARSLAGMLAQITCKDILRYQFIKSLKELIMTSEDQEISSLNQENRKLLIEIITKENSEIGCNKIIAAVQKEALKVICGDKTIMQAVNLRKQYMIDGTDFRDISNPSFNELPAQLKPLETGLTDIEFQVYKDFENIPNSDLEEHIEQEAVKLLEDDTQPPGDARNVPVDSAHQPLFEKFGVICNSFVAGGPQSAEFNNNFKKEVNEFKVMMSQIPNCQEMLTDKFLTMNNLVALDHKLVVFLIENKILTLNLWQNKFVTYIKATIETVDDIETINFVELFIIRAIVDRECVKFAQITNLMECVEMFSNTPNSPYALRWKGITNLLDIANLSSDVYDELSEIYFEEWASCTNTPALQENFCYKLSIVFKNSQHMSSFVTASLHNALRCYEDNEEEQKDFVKIDKFINMVISCGFNWTSNPRSTHQSVMDETQVFNIIWEVLSENHDEYMADFDQMPFSRILKAFLSHFYEIFKEVDNFGDIEKIKQKNDILLVFSHLFKKLNPSIYPCFAFAWLDIISSRYFMPFMLSTVSEFHNQERWLKMQELFNALFIFLKENIYENSETTPALEKFFEGTLKICLVVLHDYPEFLCYYYFQFINNLPLYRTGNLRNMILAAYPKSIRLPDPANEITKYEPSNVLHGQDRQTLLQFYVDDGDYYTLKEDLDNYQETKSDAKLKQICEYLESCQVIRNHRRIIDTGVVHATMLYLASDIEELKTVKELENPELAVKFELMCKYLSTPVRDILLNAMFNELRLLNMSTVFFLSTLLQIFRNADPEENIVSSQIARICVGRLRLPKIQPWGLLVFKSKISKEAKFKSMNITTQQQP